MSVKQQIEDDLKQAMLAGDQTLVTTLRGLKSAILNVEIAEGKREQGLSDEEITSVLSKEAKKRQESIEMYQQGGSQDRADAEAAEKAVIERYLPAQLSDEELQEIIDETISQLGASGPQAMGQVIGAVKGKVGAAADGGRIAGLVKASLQ